MEIFDDQDGPGGTGRPTLLHSVLKCLLCSVSVLVVV